MPTSSIAIIFSPYHVGLRDHRVGDGPNRLRKLDPIPQLKELGIRIHFHKILPIDDFEGEIERSFEIPRRTSIAVTRAKSNHSFPLVLSGNCIATAGVACSLSIKDPGFNYFDTHDDMDTPSMNQNGYMDAMGLSILVGRSWHYLTSTIPGYQPMKYNKMVYVGLRDLTND